MSWGGGWSKSHVPDTARTVAKAFYAGRPCKRGNCETDGRTYWLEGHPLARRIPEDEWGDAVHAALAAGKTFRPLEFTYCGFPTDMTARHLQAFGVDARIVTDYAHGPKGGLINPHKRCLMNGIAVESVKWYTLDELKTMPRWEQAKSKVAPYVAPPNNQLKSELA